MHAEWIWKVRQKKNKVHPHHDPHYDRRHTQAKQKVILAWIKDSRHPSLPPFLGRVIVNNTSPHYQNHHRQVRRVKPQKPQNPKRGNNSHRRGRKRQRTPREEMKDFDGQNWDQQRGGEVRRAWEGEQVFPSQQVFLGSHEERRMVQR